MPVDITVDTSVLIAAIANEPSKERAVQLTTGHRLVGPASIPFEIGNALSAMLKRKRISVAQAESFLDAYATIPVTLVDTDLKSAMTVVNKLRVYAYDAYVLGCALQTQSPLLTLDIPLRKAAISIGIQVLEI
jgi:predicted nucleic acid-binding protein